VTAVAVAVAGALLVFIPAAMVMPAHLHPSAGSVAGPATTPAHRPRPDPSATPDSGGVWVYPLRAPYVITVGFQTMWGVFHAGVDLACPLGTPIYAVHPGTVILARWYGGFGNGIVIDDGAGIQVIYGHASKLLVHEGQTVQAGDEIALVGSTGYSTGDHLHLEIHEGLKPIDPVEFLRSHGVNLDNPPSGDPTLSGVS
jgi:murein DD-endopeptidase MepM/ murein hydrolase activator NlpD